VQKYLEKADPCPPLADYQSLNEVCESVNSDIYGAADQNANHLPEEGEDKKEDKKEEKKDAKKAKKETKLTAKEIEARGLLKDNALSALLPEASKKLKSSSVQAKGRVIPGIEEELGFVIVICDICNYVGEDNPERHPALKKETKKVGLNSYPTLKGEKIVTLIYLEDFMNSLI